MVLPSNRHRERDVRKWIALLICPELRNELGRLHDELTAFRIERMQRTVHRWMEDPDINRLVHASQPVMQQS